jgi:hypothetical protein
MTSTGTRCDEILALIDSCLAELGLAEGPSRPTTARASTGSSGRSPR